MLNALPREYYFSNLNSITSLQSIFKLNGYIKPTKRLLKLYFFPENKLPRYERVKHVLKKLRSEEGFPTVLHK